MIEDFFEIFKYGILQDTIFSYNIQIPKYLKQFLILSRVEKCVFHVSKTDSRSAFNTALSRRFSPVWISRQWTQSPCFTRSKISEYETYRNTTLNGNEKHVSFCQFPNWRGFLIVFFVSRELHVDLAFFSFRTTSFLTTPSLIRLLK